MQRGTLNVWTRKRLVEELLNRYYRGPGPGYPKREELLSLLAGTSRSSFEGVDSIAYRYLTSEYPDLEVWRYIVKRTPNSELFHRRILAMVPDVMKDRGWDFEELREIRDGRVIVLEILSRLPKNLLGEVEEVVSLEQIRRTLFVEVVPESDAKAFRKLRAKLPDHVFYGAVEDVQRPEPYASVLFFLVDRVYEDVYGYGLEDHVRRLRRYEFLLEAFSLAWVTARGRYRTLRSPKSEQEPREEDDKTVEEYIKVKMRSPIRPSDDRMHEVAGNMLRFLETHDRVRKVWQPAEPEDPPRELGLQWTRTDYLRLLLYPLGSAEMGVLFPGLLHELVDATYDVAFRYTGRTVGNSLLSYAYESLVWELSDRPDPDPYMQLWRKIVHRTPMEVFTEATAATDKEAMREFQFTSPYYDPEPDISRPDGNKDFLELFSTFTHYSHSGGQTNGRDAARMARMMKVLLEDIPRNYAFRERAVTVAQFAFAPYRPTMTALLERVGPERFYAVTPRYKLYEPMPGRRDLTVPRTEASLRAARRSYGTILHHIVAFYTTPYDYYSLEKNEKDLRTGLVESFRALIAVAPRSVRQERDQEGNRVQLTIRRFIDSDPRMSAEKSRGFEAMLDATRLPAVIRVP